MRFLISTILCVIGVGLIYSVSGLRFPSYEYLIFFIGCVFINLAGRMGK